MVRTDTIPVYMLTWYKFHYGLNLMRPPAVCVPTVSGKPLSHLPAPTPTRPSIQVAIPASPSHISLYKVSTFLSRSSSFFFSPMDCFFSPMDRFLLRTVDTAIRARVARCAFEVIVSYSGKIKVLRVDSSHSEAVLRIIR